MQERIKLQIEKGVGAREAGDYTVGQRELRQAFEKTVEIKDRDLAIEAGSQYSIQCRLIAGRASRKGDKRTAATFSDRALKVFAQLKDLGFYNSDDPSITRGWSHALLYAGNVDEAIIELKRSAEAQDNPAAKGDELCHLASAYCYTGDLKRASQLVERGIKLIKDNKGSPIWLTYGLMTKASISAQSGKEKEVKELLNDALQIAENEGLAVRKEEIEFLLGKKGKDVNVLKAVGNYL